MIWPTWNGDGKRNNPTSVEIENAFRIGGRFSLLVGLFKGIGRNLPIEAIFRRLGAV